MKKNSTVYTETPIFEGIIQSKWAHNFLTDRTDTSKLIICFFLTFLAIFSFTEHVNGQSSSDGPCGNCFNYILVDDNTVEFDFSDAFSNSRIKRKEFVIQNTSNGCIPSK